MSRIRINIGYSKVVIYLVEPSRPWGKLPPHNPKSSHGEAGKSHASFFSGFRSSSIDIFSPLAAGGISVTGANGMGSASGSAVELIHPSVFQQDFQNAPGLWPEAIRDTVRRAQLEGGGIIATMDDMELELKDSGFLGNGIRHS